MEKEIVDIIYKYSKENKNIDVDFINKTIEIIKDYYCLDSYIRKTTFSNSNSFYQAGYCLNTKEIIVCLNSINSILSILEEEFNCIRTLPLFKYLFIVKILSHEIEHANQLKKVKENNNIESEILKAEYTPVFEYLRRQSFLGIIRAAKHRNLRKKYYLFSPCERLAETVACETAQKLSLAMSDETSYDIMEYFILDNISRGYNMGLINNLSDAPTKTYLEKINPHYHYSNIMNLSQNVESKDKMRYGLEAPKEELRRTENKCLILYNKILNKKY